jgi:hypothetical protein
MCCVRVRVLCAVQVYGDVKCNCRLSGMPDLTLTYTRPQVLEDVALHRCVRINRFEVSSALVSGVVYGCGMEPHRTRGGMRVFAECWVRRNENLSFHLV